MSQRSYISDAFRAGATDYVTKPFDLVDLRGRVASAVRQSKRLAASSKSQAQVLSEALSLHNVTRFLGHDEYENYVMQVSQSLTSKSSVVGIKIQNGRRLHDAVGPKAFEEVIQTVGEAISELTRQEGHMISYRGNGVFLCIRIGRNDKLPESFEMMLNRQIHAIKPASLTKASIKVSVGETTILNAASKVGALDALSAATASAEQKAEHVTSAPHISRRMLSNQSRSPEQERVERRVYSLMLKDVMREGGPVQPNFGRNTR